MKKKMLMMVCQSSKRMVFENMLLRMGRVIYLQRDRVRKIRITGPLAKPKKEASPMKHSGPPVKHQRRGTPIEVFRPVGASPE